MNNEDWINRDEYFFSIKWRCYSKISIFDDRKPNQFHKSVNVLGHENIYSKKELS
jgi:hypothetical protein